MCHPFGESIEVSYPCAVIMPGDDYQNLWDQRSPIRPSQNLLHKRTNFLQRTRKVSKI